ncbi:MAG: CHRD domain-containing protein [Leptolyngbyaceae bacterium]|nr:CHRD domain-containing protein [Leptolyngbyaceae bacterium]
MRNLIKMMQFILLGTLSCVLLSGLFSPTCSQAIAAFSSHIGSDASAQIAQKNSFLGQALTTNLQEAQDILLAQNPGSTLQSYVAVMSDDNVVPNSPDTGARGAVGAVLSSDNRFIVRGSFGNLTSPMRDYATDPVNPPNTNITSAFHIHQGVPTENGPFQYALDVTLDSTGRGGSAAGEYTLTPEQLQALADGRLYVDIHTTENRGGELRAILMPY